MDTLLLWPNMFVPITLLFEGVGTLYLVRRSFKATTICGMFCHYGHVVNMATDKYLKILSFESI